MFDLVVACEVLYYVKDIPRFLDRLSRLGRACLVTYYQGQAPVLDSHFASLPDCRRDQFRFDDTEWRCGLAGILSIGRGDQYKWKELHLSLGIFVRLIERLPLNFAKIVNT